GGFGTLDEFFETLTLLQTKSIKQFPIVLFGVEYHKGLIDYCNYLVKEGTISEEDMKLVLVTDSIDEAMEHIMAYITANYKVVPRRKKWWMMEKR
ncbi:MAG: LOG family protein, partial [Flavitalea sp.]